MAKTNVLNTRTINYMELIGNGKSYHVPKYQRDYSWSEEQWENLWNDIVELRSNAQDHHYIGALVIEGKSDREFLVIDGQQRLATLSLFALAAIGKLRAMADKEIDPEPNRERAQRLRSRFIIEKDPASLTENARLLLNDTDNDFYRDYLVQLKKPHNPGKLPKSNRLLWECFLYFTERLDKLEDLNTDGEAMTSIISETAARRLLFILITVDDELDAYTVFKTSDAQGQTNLLRHYLFSQVKTRADLEALQHRWTNLIATVDEEQFAEFLRYHLLCKQSEVRRRHLFKLVQDQVKTQEDVFLLLDELEMRADLFAAFSDPSHDYWMEMPDAKSYIRELNLFRAHQMIPLVFAARESFSEEDFVRVLKLLSVISFRYNVISDLNTNVLERVYPDAARAVINGDATSPADVFELIKPIYVEDGKMRLDFSLFVINPRGRKKKLAKYILARFEQDASGRSCDFETDPGTIEHILPENPIEAWKETFAPQLWEPSVYRLGNLTLLKSAANREIGNKTYTDKVVAYKDSEYILTKEILEIAPEQWTPELMNKRQKRLAARSVHLWKSDFA